MSRRGRPVFLLPLLLALWPHGARAVSDAATRFLLVPGGARPAGLAGSYAALADDADAVRANPGGLAWIERSEAALTHERYVLFITGGEAASAVPTGLGRVGVHVAWLTDDQERRDAQGGAKGYFQNTYLTAAVGDGWKLTDALGVGLAVRYVGITLAGAEAAGLAADLGASWRDPDGWRAGLALRHLGVMQSVAGAPADLPLLAEAALARAVAGERLVGTLDGQLVAGGGGGGGAGVEWKPASAVALRAGIALRRLGTGEPFLAEAAFGLGVNAAGYGADYAVTPMGYMGTAHRFSLRVSY